MKTQNNNNQQNQTPSKAAGNKPRPEIRDNMDSRHRKPQNYKGDLSHKNDKPKHKD